MKSSIKGWKRVEVTQFRRFNKVTSFSFLNWSSHMFAFLYFPTFLYLQIHNLYNHPVIILYVSILILTIQFEYFHIFLKKLFHFKCTILFSSSIHEDSIAIIDVAKITIKTTFCIRYISSHIGKYLPFTKKTWRNWLTQDRWLKIQLLSPRLREPITDFVKMKNSNFQMRLILMRHTLHLRRRINRSPV